MTSQPRHTEGVDSFQIIGLGTAAGLLALVASDHVGGVPAIGSFLAFMLLLMLWPEPTAQRAHQSD